MGLSSPLYSTVAPSLSGLISSMVPRRGLVKYRIPVLGSIFMSSKLSTSLAITVGSSDPGKFGDELIRHIDVVLNFELASEELMAIVLTVQRILHDLIVIGEEVENIFPAIDRVLYSPRSRYCLLFIRITFVHLWQNQIVR